MGRCQYMLTLLLFSRYRDHRGCGMDCFNNNESAARRTTSFHVRIHNILIQILIRNSRQNKIAHSFDFMYRVIHKAWRLVVPAVVCFGISAICCCVYAAYLNSALNSFCDEFKYKFTNHEIPCRLHLNRFSIRDDTALTAANNFHTAKSVAYIRIFQWLLAGFVMLLRCILGADFEMQEIEYCAGKCV